MSYWPTDTWRENPQWKAESPAGTLDITINLAKPEKDPRAIAAAASRDAEAPHEGSGTFRRERAMPFPSAGKDTQPATLRRERAMPFPPTEEDARPGRQGQSPCPTEDDARCDLCWVPSAPDAPAHLARTGEEVRTVMLQEEPWAWWYSPYGYFPEHLIVAAPEHRPMKIDGATVMCLLDFCDAHPEYFIGSNADLPIVGGSILSHDHFQGGRYRFPLMDAPLARPFPFPDVPEVQAAIVAWPACVIRLRTGDRAALAAAATRVIEAWRVFSDEDCGIWAAAGSVQHNTLNPILWREGADYVMDLVLRNNRTTPERPYGLFHPDESLFHIKKENIGLIEIMGRAILPARLAAELPGIKDEASRAFYQVLVATGVFKQNPQGEAGWNRFLTTL